jgi:hypothetical protein
VPNYLVACKQGYDSHYALVRQVSGLIYMPVKPGEMPEYDELVVFKKEQILPRYIYYYRSVSSPNSDAQQSAQLMHTLWLESAPSASTLRMLHVLKDKYPNVRVIQIGSVDELTVWLYNRPELAERQVRVVCGTDTTGETSQRLLAMLRNKSKIAVLFTQREVPDSWLNGKTLLASRDPMRAAEFSVFLWPSANTN